MDCRHRGHVCHPANTHEGKTHPDVYYCAAGKFLCTIDPNDLPFFGGTLPVCGTHCDRFVELKPPTLPTFTTDTTPITAANFQPQGKFCYFTGSNRRDEGLIVTTMIRSARAVGVTEDFHVFCTSHVENAINHGANFEFDSYMFKVALLQRLAGLDYEYFVCLDTDNYFVRHPGDFSELLRDEPIWVSMEGDLAAPDAAKNWWGIGGNPGLPSLVDTMRSFGISSKNVWNTNAGMFIVRKEAIRQFASEMYRVRDELVKKGFSGTTEEPPLAIVGQTMVKDPLFNTFDRHKHIWTSDWIQAVSGGKTLPDGKPFQHKDWATQKIVGDVNPAIVHVMRGKTHMANAGKPVATDHLTCGYRGKPIGEQLNCNCSIDREIYRCAKKGLCLKRLPPATTQESLPQLAGVTICAGCDEWKH